ncbi:MAG: YciI family protein [Mesorhizobium sp.]
MKYLCLVYGEERKLEAMSKAEMKRLDEDSMGYDKELEKSGHLIVAEALQSVRNATTVRVRDEQVDILDGPFAETKEQLLGFIMIEASDKEDAIGVASKIPLVRLGAVEVRPVVIWDD